MKHVKLFMGLFLVLLFLIPLSCTNPVVPTSGETSAVMKRVTDRETLDGGVLYESGVLGPGALYELWVPPEADWMKTGNSLVVYVHGYVSAALPVALPSDIEGFRNMLLSQGFAVAYSSFSENGWAVKDGAIRTRQLLGYFKDNYGKPGKSYLVGVSEGGLISLMLTEKNHNLFDGTLALSAPLGGAQMVSGYLIDIRLLFDYYLRELFALLPPPYNGVAAELDAALGEGALDAAWEGSGLPADGAAFAGYVTPTVAALLGLAPPESIFAMATMTVDGKPLFNWPPAMLAPPYLFLPEMAVTISTALWFNIFGTPDILGRTHDHVMIDNMESVYSSPLMEPRHNDELNDGIERLAARPDAVKYLEHWYLPEGNLRIPVVTLHTTRDPIVPILNEYAFRDIVGNGGQEFLAQFVVPGFGHCQVLQYDPALYTFVPDPGFGDQLAAAFNYLAVWSASGVKPDPDNFYLTPLP